MKIVVLVCRILLGLIFLIFGLNGFHPFLPMKAEGMPQAALTWVGVMASTGWMTAISGVQVVGSLLVLTGFLLPLGLVLLCAQTFNILCFHLFLVGGHGIAPGVATGVFELVLIYGYRDSFRGLLQPKAPLSI